MTEHTTVGGVDLDSRHLALQGGDGRNQVRVELVALQLRHGIAEGLGGTLHTEGRNNDVIKHSGVSRKGDVDRLTIVHDTLGGISKAVDTQGLAVPHSGEGERTVRVRHCTYGSPIDDDGCADHGLAIISFDDTLRRSLCE